MNCYIIDDEKHAINLLLEYIGRLNNFNVVGTNLNPKEALKEIKALNNVDLVFNDINMAELSGFEVIKQLPKNVQAIVTTVNSYYRETATQLGVSGYLLKPFEFAAFQKTVKKLKARG